ncbi:hypothetical protein HYY73_05115 [Candidatus Woesearchaeota archaeon]|nr:hypothetical protein [Candidatus Woesearchaeota archaeon]
MVKVSRPVAITGSIAALVVGVAAAAYTGLPPPDGWFFKTVDFAYHSVKSAAPEGVRQFIDQHPVYTAGLEGLVGGSVITAAAVFFAMRHYYSSKNKLKK